MEETSFHRRANLIVKFEVIVKDEAKIFCMGVDIGGEGAQGVGGRCGGVSEDNNFCFIAV